MKELLTLLYGVGEVLAEKLYQKLLKLGLVNPTKSYTEAEMRTLLKNSSLFSELPQATRADLIYNPDKSIPRNTMDYLNAKLTHKFPIVIAGSYRRGKLVSRDADILLPHNVQFSALQREFSKRSDVIIHEPFASGTSKISVMISISSKRTTLKADIFLVPKDEWIYALLYATGSGHFNLLMRAQAKRKGFLLNQRGLWKNGKRVAIKDENEIFKTLGMKYKKPEERN